MVYCGSVFGAIGGSIEHANQQGTLEDPSQTPPDVHIYTSTKLPWVQLQRNTPEMEEYYQRSKVWSEASVARFKKALGKA